MATSARDGEFQSSNGCAVNSEDVVYTSMKTESMAACMDYEIPTLRSSFKNLG